MQQGLPRIIWHDFCRDNRGSSLLLPFWQSDILSSGRCKPNNPVITPLSPCNHPVITPFWWLFVCFLEGLWVMGYRLRVMGYGLPVMGYRLWDF